MMIALLSTFCLLLFVKSKTSKSWINDFLFIMGPYVIISAINNLIMVDAMQFYKIEDKVLMAIMVAQIAFFFGSVIGDVASSSSIKNSKTIAQNAIQLNEPTIRLKSAIRFLLFVDSIFVFASVFKLLTSGFAVIAQNDFEAMKLGGLTGHLFLMTYCLVPIVLYESLNAKNKKGIFVVLLTFVCAFLTFVKYNIITMILMVCLYFVLRDRRYAKRVVLCGLGSIATLFILNYSILFISAGGYSVDTMTFIFSHLWMYISSGITMMNYVVGSAAVVNIADCLVSMIAPIPNMFLSLVTSYRIEAANNFGSVLGTTQLVSGRGERSNAFCVLGTFYSNGTNIISFAVVMFIWGLLSAVVLNNVKKDNARGVVNMTWVVLLTYSVLSFFSNYWTLSTPWEILIYSAIIPAIWGRKGRIRIKW